MTYLGDTMTERFRFLDALTFSVRAVAWRPVHIAFYLGAVTVLYFLSYAWVASDAGVAFMTSYAQSTADMAQGHYGAGSSTIGLLMLGSMLMGVIMLAGGYRVLSAEKPAAWLPLQVGLDELRVAAVYLFVMALTIGLMMIMVVVLSIAAVVFAVALGPTLSSGASPDPTQAVLAMIVLMAVLMLPLGYIGGRISVCFALTIRDRRLRLGGWKASKGAGMQLLFAHLIIYGVVMGVQIALMPDLWTLMASGLTNPEIASDPAHMTELMAAATQGPSAFALPFQAVSMLLLLGPTAAVAAWDSRKSIAASDDAGAQPGSAQ
jgi:hypothetical protein